MSADDEKSTMSYNDDLMICRRCATYCSSGARDGAMMVWDVRCPAIMCNRSNTAYQAPVLAVQVSCQPGKLRIMRLDII